MGVEDAEIGLKISGVDKIYSKPVLWKITLELPDSEFRTVKVNTKDLFMFRLFQAAFFEQAHIMLPETKPSVWIELLASCLAPETSMRSGHLEWSPKE